MIPMTTSTATAMIPMTVLRVRWLGFVPLSTGFSSTSRP